MADATSPLFGDELDTGSFEEAWARIRTQMELQPDEFWLGLVFTPDALLAAELTRRINRHRVNEGSSPGHTLTAQTPAQLASAWAVIEQAAQSAGSVTMVSVHPGNVRDDLTGWGAAWRDMLLAMNERRDWLRSKLRGPLVLVMHPDMRRDVKYIAPDLWSYRSAVVSFRRRAPSLDVAQLMHGPELTWPSEWGDLDARLGAAPTANPDLAASLRDLGRVERNGASSLAGVERVWRSAVSASDEGLAAAAMARSLAETDPLVAVGLAEKALCSDVPLGGETLLELLRLLGNSRRPERLVALSGAVTVGRRWASAPRLDYLLDDLAAGALDEGRLDIAASAYTESLGVRRRLLAEFGERPEWLRDVSVSLDNVGRVALAQGDLENARASYTESLRYCDRAITASRTAMVYQKDREWIVAALAKLPMAPNGGPV